MYLNNVDSRNSQFKITNNTSASRNREYENDLACKKGNFGIVSDKWCSGDSVEIKNRLVESQEINKQS